MKKNKADILCIAIIICLVTLCFLRLFYPKPMLIVTPDFGRSDAWHFSFATKYFLWQKLQKNTLPLWTDLVGGGFPIFAEGQTGTLFLPNLILYKLFNAVTAYNLSIVFLFLTASLGMYAFLRMLQLCTFASLFGSLIFAFSGMFIAQMTHITLLQGFSMMPIIFATVYKLITSQNFKWRLILAFLISQQIFTGFPQAVFITGLGVFLYIFSFSRKRLFMNMIRFLSSYLIGFSLSAVQLIPSFEFYMHLVNSNMMPKKAVQFSFPLVHILTFFHPFALGNPKYGTYASFKIFSGSIFWENMGYIGLLPLFFIPFLILFYKGTDKKTRSLILFFVFLLALSFLFMLGKYSPLYIAYSFFPFSLFRVPSRFIWPFVLSLAVLSSYAIHSFWKKFEQKGFCKGIIMGVALLNMFHLIYIFSDYQLLEPAEKWLETPETVKYIEKEGKIFGVGFIQEYNTPFFSYGWNGKNPYFFLRSALVEDSNVIWGVQHYGVYAGRFLKRQTIIDNMISENIFVTEKEATISATGRKLLQLNSVSSILSIPQLKDSSHSYKGEVQSDFKSIKVYSNSSYLPRIYMPQRLIKVETIGDAYREIYKDTFIPGESALVEKDLSLEEHPRNAELHITHENDTLVTISVINNSQEGLLVLGDTYYPGWEATVDNVKKEILPVNVRHRGVIVPQGNHTVVFKYRPKSLYIGACLTLLSILGCVTLIVVRLFSPKPQIH